MLSTFSQYFMTLSATENLAEKMVHLFGDTIPSWLTVFIISLFPILENRGGMIAARLLNMNMLQAFIISYLGNLVPIPFILLFIKKIFEWLRKIKGFDKIIKHFEAKAEKPAIEVFEEAMNNIMPVLEVKARRIGGATYQVPIEVKPDRRQALALRWMTAYSRARGEKTMEERLANEILDAANNTGSSVKKKEDMHKMAEANKAFAHYRF